MGTGGEASGEPTASVYGDRRGIKEHISALSH